MNSTRVPTASAILGITFLVIGTIAVIWLVLPIWNIQNLNDDSFITLTYAKNLVAGNGFVYNHPPATLGTTSPLFVFLVAGIAVITRLTVVQTAIFVSGLAWAAAGWVLYTSFRQHQWSPVGAGIVALLVMTIGYAWQPLVGMEIWLFEFLLVLLILLSQKRQQFWAGIIVGLLFLTRGEGILLAPVIGLYLWRKNGQFPLKFVVGGTLVGIVWV